MMSDFDAELKAMSGPNPVIQQLTDQLARVTQERDQLKRTLDIMQQESLHVDRYASENEGELARLRDVVTRAREEAERVNNSDALFGSKTTARSLLAILSETFGGGE